jgi:TonB family protein
MAKRERFGKFVLLEPCDASGVGVEYRAAKLGGSGLEKIVSLLRLAPAVSSHAEVAKALMDQAKFAAQLQSPNIVKILGIGKVDASYYISSEFIEGKSLRAVFSRCRQDGFPFSVDHTLLIASKLCSALEYAHSRKTDTGARYFHGLLTATSVVISYEGEVRVRGFGSWPARVQETGALAQDDKLYLAPEQDASGKGDPRSDTFAVGALLFETLTGKPLFEGGRNGDPLARVAKARLHNPTSDDPSLPKPISEILKRALSADPAGRFAEIQEMRKAIDTLLFSGDFTPTTFNLAFFMHSLFRDDIERESRLLKEEKESSYQEFLTEEPARAAGAPAARSDATAADTTLPADSTSVTLPPFPAVKLPPPAAPSPKPEPAPAPEAKPRVEQPPAPDAAATLISPTPLPLVYPPSSPAHPAAAPHAPPPRASAAAAHTPLPSRSAATPVTHTPPPGRHTPAPMPVHEPESAAGMSPKDAAASFTFHKDEAKKNQLPLIGGLAALALVTAGGAYWLTRRASAPPPPPVTTPATLSAEAQAAMMRVRELEEKLAALEAEKKAAEEKAAEDAKKKVEAQAKAKGQAVDPAALAQAQEDERRKARAEQERRQQEEQRKLEEQKKAEEARLAEEQKRAEELRQAEEAARIAAAAAPPTTLPPPPTAPPEPEVKPGTLMNLSDPGVIAPLAESKPKLSYPVLARRQRVEGTVEMSVLIDETGKVADAQVVSGPSIKVGLAEAAVDYVKRWKFRPATKNGVPLKVWLPVKIEFVLPN